MPRVPRQFRAIPDPEHDGLGEVIADLRRLEKFARERGDSSRADQLAAIAAAYEIEQRRQRELG